MLVLSILALITALIQKTPYAFLGKDAADFVWGITAGLCIGTVVAWFGAASPRD
jgi:uncharacterized membrane protein YoaK (UPF0700 family)